MTDYDLPPGPGTPAWLNSLALLGSRAGRLTGLRERYGDSFAVRILPPGRRLVAVSRPEDIKAVFAGDPEQFHAGEANSLLSLSLGMHSVLLVDDEQHRRARRLLMPAFSGAAMRGYRPMFAAIAHEHVATWRDGQTIASLDEMNRLTLDVILRVVFGVGDAERLEQMRPVVNRVLDVRTWVLLASDVPWLRRFGPWKRYVQDLRALDVLIYRQIAERRATPSTDEDADVLSRLLAAEGLEPGSTQDGEADGLSDAELRDQLVTLLLAGHETTATALAWTLQELGLHPELLGRACAAADTGDDAFLEACLKESMRLHPVVELVGRVLQSDQTVNGRRLPRGSMVTAAIALTHADPEVWSEPEQFRPSRFLEGKVSPNEWLPFGGGVRRCIGAAFSLSEGVEVLRAVLSSFEVEAPSSSPARLRNVVAYPADHAPLTLTQRAIAAPRATT